MIEPIALASAWNELTEEQRLLILGDVDGHEFHGNQYVSGSKGEADAASAHADRESKRADSYFGQFRGRETQSLRHQQAQSAHEKAASLHYKLGNTKKSAEHHVKADEHRSKSHPTQPGSYRDITSARD